MLPAKPRRGRYQVRLARLSDCLRISTPDSRRGLGPDLRRAQHPSQRQDLRLEFGPDFRRVRAMSPRSNLMRVLGQDLQQDHVPSPR
mmetsp:Transcript_122411/g.346048  ORF Transcript_122411/g.346048 Transcript_122411/m.346048 type:complete len:87 (+) Transcript_122411:876-1136(+)